MKTIILIFFCFLFGIKSFAQTDQKALIADINAKLNKVDSVIIERDTKNVLPMIHEILSMSEDIENKKTRLLVYSVSINKFNEARLFPNSISLSLSAIQKAKDIYGPKHQIVAHFLTRLAICYAYDNQQQNAILYGKQSVEMLEELEEYGELFLMATSQLTTYYNENHQYPEAIGILKKSLQHFDPQNIPAARLAVIYQSLADNYSRLNNYPIALNYTKQALDLYEDKQSLDYLRLMRELALLYSKNNYHEDAIHTINEVCKSLKERNEDAKYALTLCDKASIYICSGEKSKINEAILFANEAIKIFERTDNMLSDDYVNALMTLAEIYRSIDLYDNSQEIHKKIYNLQKKFLDKSNIDDLDILAMSAVLANELQEGLSLFQILKKKISQEKGEKSVDYANVVFRLSELYCFLHDYDNAIKGIIEVLPIMRSDLAKSFFQLEDNERAGFWNKYNYVFREYLPKMCYAPSNSPLSWLMFDVSLLSKGLLLNTERMKRELMQEEVSVYDFVDPFFLKWRDIQARLNDNDIAIEFMDITINKDSTVYVALTLRNDSKVPQLITLFDEKQLMNVSDTLYYQCKEMTDLVWKPLLQELEGVKNIYFSPSGALYNIGIEYLPGMEDYNIYRLSSTRELVKGNETITGNRAVLYGGLDYYAEFDTTSRNQTMPDYAFVEHADVRSMDLRGGKQFLKHTKDEVVVINNELNKANWTCQLDTLSLGTEESFKSLSGKKVNTLHIATHGFYYTQEEADNTDYKFLQFDNRFTSVEDKSLTRSGLIMAGANHILEGEELPDNVEDGILTAKEIADVDLRGLDLVVLSACQTGLGDISLGEGVFGLQRGFKKAGANSILMSLWEVEDEATQILMTQFYKNHVSGQSKRQSLQSAQRYLQEYNSGQYNKPEYWAAFILLDAIN